MDRQAVEALIQEQVAASIAQDAPKTSTFMRLATRMPNMTSNQTRVPVLDFLPVSYWVNGDNGVKGLSRQSWDKVYLNAAEIATIIPIPEAVLADASYDVVGEIIPRIVESFGQAIDQAVFFGIKRPLEWPNDIATLARNAGNNVSGGITYDNLLGVGGIISKVEGAGYMVDGVISSISARGALRGLKDTNGHPLYLSDMKGTSSPYTLDGAPMFFPDNGSFDVSTAQLLAGNFKSAVYAVRQDVTIKILTEASVYDPGTKQLIYALAQQDMIAVRAVMRLGWALPNPATRLNTDRTNVPFAYIEAATPVTTKTVTVTVKDNGGDNASAITNATVDINGSIKKTNASGAAVFNLIPGTYTHRRSGQGRHFRASKRRTGDFGYADVPPCVRRWRKVPLS
ncbi:hypothetical protein FACS1894202_11190 [Clostridia bacterium]|nr:hypothetical protein FACS1894202_11190 [Clostridia bacterium]